VPETKAMLHLKPNESGQLHTQTSLPLQKELLTPMEYKIMHHILLTCSVAKEFAKPEIMDLIL
jgi:hypothetical protein